MARCDFSSARLTNGEVAGGFERQIVGHAVQDHGFAAHLTAHVPRDLLRVLDADGPHARPRPGAQFFRRVPALRMEAQAAAIDVQRLDDLTRGVLDGGQHLIAVQTNQGRGQLAGEPIEDRQGLGLSVLLSGGVEGVPGGIHADSYSNSYNDKGAGRGNSLT